ncbi:MAG: hypothetical protein K5746_03470 [Clostridiales bacterium]|nr:hypothetical protein [Clostridiales bacterium]
MRTIEDGCAVVEVIAWPEDKPWQNRYQTASSIERGICRLVLSPGVFHDAAKANTAYRRFAGKIERAGLVPPNVSFREMNSTPSQKIFCIMTVGEAVFNSACRIGKMSVMESGTGDARKVCAVLLGEAEMPWITEDEEAAAIAAGA